MKEAKQESGDDVCDPEDGQTQLIQVTMNIQIEKWKSENAQYYR